MGALCLCALDLRLTSLNLLARVTPPYTRPQQGSNQRPLWIRYRHHLRLKCVDKEQVYPTCVSLCDHVGCLFGVKAEYQVAFV